MLSGLVSLPPELPLCRPEDKRYWSGQATGHVFYSVESTALEGTSWLCMSTNSQRGMMGSTVVAGGAEVEEGVVEVQEDTAWNMAITCMLLDDLPPPSTSCTVQTFSFGWL